MNPEKPSSKTIDQLPSEVDGKSSTKHEIKRRLEMIDKLLQHCDIIQTHKKRQTR